jgi:hypothetical protein
MQVVNSQGIANLPLHYHHGYLFFWSSDKEEESVKNIQQKRRILCHSGDGGLSWRASFDKLRVNSAKQS